MGKFLAEQAVLRKLTRLERMFLRSIPAKYRRYRVEWAKESPWYQAAPSNRFDIHWRELDIVILATLQVANQMLQNYRGRPSVDLPEDDFLLSMGNLLRAQVLVDEATDFSGVQLACMYELAHPAIKSFFLCGDLNQRLTIWGIKTNQELERIVPKIQHHCITVSYRQSERLVELAKQVAKIGGADADEIILPERLDDMGVAPVWETGLENIDNTALWLADRIKEIDRMYQNTPTIAVLLNEEEQIAPLATQLTTLLADISLSAAACMDGKVVGNEMDVRVFGIEHIKGLEFETAFFVDLDQTIEKHPELFTKYLYVGATRAAMFLGITFRGDVPTEVNSLAGHFGRDWSS